MVSLEEKRREEKWQGLGVFCAMAGAMREDWKVDVELSTEYGVRK